ncbi:hypothetical protein [Staphylococcus equorum]|nr:hypothetical protein [Staphylococcus equorum]MDW5472292.1 hypothetical protein [Staphylococcus equorum]
MAKYDAFELDIVEGQITNLDNLNNKKEINRKWEYIIYIHK